MNSVLIGNGYWGTIIQSKIARLTNLIAVLDSSGDINAFSNIDIVFVCSSTNSHYEVVKKCLAADIKIIFCEKPFTGDYDKAIELYKIAEEKNIRIFVDNIFLYREEITTIKIIPFKKITFIWNKKDVNFKENIIDSLLYHDLYLLIKLTENIQWEIDYKKISNTELKIGLCNEKFRVYFLYNRNKNVKEKKIIMDSITLDLTDCKKDVLFEIIENLKNNVINFEGNKKITLQTLKLFNQLVNNE